MLEHLQTFLRLPIDQIGHEQIAERAPMAPAHATTQLIELREPETVGAVHNHRVGVRHVQAGFDDHRRHQHIDLPPHELSHDGFQIGLPHLPVRDRPPCPGRERLNARRHRIDRLDAVVYEVHLPAPIEFARHGLLEQRIVPRLDKRQHGRTVLRRRLE